MGSLTLMAQTEALVHCGWQLPRGYEIRPVQENDAPALAELYLAAYPREIVQDLAAAEEEMRRTFGGEYGSLVAELSPLITTTGQVVATLVDGPRPAGRHQVAFAGVDLASGAYLYRLSHDRGALTRLMLLLK